MKKEKGLVYLVAGGTAGHINGAIAVGEKLQDYDIQYISSCRDIDKKILSDYQSWHFDGRALKGKGILTTLKNIFFNTNVFLKTCLKLFKQKPLVAIGFGGFVCGPVLLACFIMRVPIYIVEQNSVMGLANRLLMPFVKNVFTHFETTKGLPSKYKEKVIVTGNPIRSSIKYLFKNRLEVFNILVFGGSLGAREINEYMKKIFEENFSFKVSVKHQVGKGNEIDIIAGENINYEQLSYIDDMEKAYHWADFIIARGGASTISELEVIKKPSYIVPYPHADQHQKFNGESLARKVKFPVWVLKSEESFEKKCADIKKSIEKVYSLLPEDYGHIKNRDAASEIVNNIKALL